MRHSEVARLIENRLISVWKQLASCTVRLQGRPSWPSARSTDRIYSFILAATLHLYVGTDRPTPNILCKSLILSRLQHSAAVGVGFIPTLAAAGCYLDSCPTLVGRG